MQQNKKIYICYKVVFHLIFVAFHHVLLQFLEPKNGEVDVHAYFEKLLRELNKPDAKYALSTANRLYGEQSFSFVEVCICEPVGFLPSQGSTHPYPQRHQ